MNNFWNNISRYPRFFLSSLIGLVLIILEPFKNLFKIPKWRIPVIAILLILLSATYITIQNMTGV